MQAPIQNFGMIWMILHLSLTGINAQTTPDSIYSGADAICKRHIQELVYEDAHKLVVKTLLEITVLNENGRKHTDFVIPYSPDESIKKLEATLYGADGKKIRSYREKDFTDQSVLMESTMLHDYRIKVLQVFYPNYPYTVVLETSQQINHILGIPGWMPQMDYRIGVEYSSYSFTYHDQFPIKYRLNMLDQPLRSVPKPGLTNLKWEIRNLVPVQEEMYSPDFDEQTPSLYLVPECFEYRGSEGCYLDWNTYGKWVGSLLKSRSDTNEDMEKAVKELVRNVEDEREKIKLIYKYMQNRTRYVSIQLGIGGFQPFPATQVEETGWGDCKALANYTKTLLHIAGIDAHYCVIGVDNREIKYDDFPSPDQANHVILGVPVEADTMWLECTSQQLPFGFIPYSLQGRKVLWVDEKLDAGTLVSIPQPETSYNTRQRNIHLDLDANGNATGNMETLVKGGEISWLFPEIWMPEKEKERLIKEKYMMPGFSLLSFDFVLDETGNSFASEKITMNLNQMASKTGDRLFVKSNMFGSKKNIPVKIKKRRAKLMIQNSFHHQDTVTIKIPEGYKVEHLPEGFELNKAFGNVKATYEIKGNQLIYTKILNVRHYTGQPAEYNEFVDFLMQVNKADEQNFVLVKI